MTDSQIQWHQLSTTSINVWALRYLEPTLSYALASGCYLGPLILGHRLLLSVGIKVTLGLSDTPNDLGIRALQVRTTGPRDLQLNRPLKTSPAPGLQASPRCTGRIKSLPRMAST